MDTPSRQKIIKGALDLNYTLDQMDLTDIYKTFHPTETEFTFFLSSHGTVSRIGKMLGYKQVLTNLRELKSYELSFPITI
jgi:hypothetical protein